MDDVTRKNLEKAQDRIGSVRMWPDEALGQNTSQALRTKMIRWDRRLIELANEIEEEIKT